MSFKSWFEIKIDSSFGSCFDPQINFAYKFKLFRKLNFLSTIIQLFLNFFYQNQSIIHSKCNEIHVSLFSSCNLIILSLKCCFTLPTSTVVSANEITALNINSKESLWIDRGWRTTDTDKDSGLSESKLLSHVNSSQSNYNNSDGGTDYAEVDTRNLTTFYNCRKVRFICLHHKFFSLLITSIL